MVPQRRSEIDIILCHIGQFFALLSTLPTPNPPHNPKNQNFEKKEKKKKEKSAWRSCPFINTCVPQIKIISNDTWFLKYKVRQTFSSC